MLLRLARDVGVLAGRQIESLERLDLGQQVERPKDRRSPNADVLPARLGHQLGRGEVAALLADQLDQRLARAGHAAARLGERVVDTESHHAEMILGLM